MRIYFSNRKLWNSYFIISAVAAAFLFLLLLLFYRFIFMVIIIVICAPLMIHFAQTFTQMHKKVYLQIKEEGIYISKVFGNSNDYFKLENILRMRKKKNIIEFNVSHSEKLNQISKINYEEENKIKINLSYVNAEDNKKLLNYLKYHPSIQAKKLFI